MTSPLAIRLAQRIVRAVATLVPAVARSDWRREWEAELVHHAARRGPAWRTNVDLIRRALGSFADAAWIRRQITLDADVVQDSVHALRMFAATPGFTAITLLVFTLGIGSTTAIVSVADALLMRPLVVPEPGRLMTIWQRNAETGALQDDVAPANALDWMQRVRSFETMAIAEPWSMSTTLPGREPEYVTAARVTEGFFTAIGAPLLHGRAFLAQEHRRGGGRVTVLSYTFWRDRFGSDPAIVGRAIRLDDNDPYTVAGVAAPGLELRLFDTRATRFEPALWLPKQGIEDFERTNRGSGYWNVVGRLARGVSIEQARRELDAVSAQLAREYPRTNRHVTARVMPLRRHLVGSLSEVLPLLLGAAAILLLAACANVAHLLLARGASRSRELAVRQALGASRGRLIRQMLLESLLLAAAGGAAGLALARWTLDTIAALRPLDVAVIDRIPIDVRAAAIACVVTLAASLLAGLAPALQLSRPVAAAALKDTRVSARRGARRALVVFEMAAALVLATGAGLLVRSFVTIQRIDPGFRQDDVLALQLFTTSRLDTAAKRIVFFEQALDRLRALPGVVATGGVSSMPFGEAKVTIRTSLTIAGRSTRGDDALVLTSAVAGDYFKAMGVPLLEGRSFEPGDGARGRQVALVSRAAVRQFWPGTNPIGSRVGFRFAGTVFDAEVIGIVGDVRHEALDRPAAAELFVPYAQTGFRALTLVARTAPGAPITHDALKQQIWWLDPLQPIFHSATVGHLVSKTLVGRRFTLFLLGGFALATLLLASAGVYGVMSFSTSQRTREFGVRLALGATRSDIVRLVLGEGLMLAGLGVLAGLVAAIPLTGLLRSLLFGVSAADPVTFALVSLLLIAIAAAACCLPASRALKVDPVKALRTD